MKRFTATEKWSDSWFRKLKPGHKVFWEYIRDNCDVSAVWKVDLELAAYFIGGGATLDPVEIIAAFEGRIVDIGRGRWWVPSFIPFQYGKLSEKCDFHKTVLKKLDSHGLMACWEAYLIDRASAEKIDMDPPTPLPPPLPVGGHKKEREEKEEEAIRVRGEGERDMPVEFPKGFPPDEKQAIEWARVGGCRATDDQIRLFWNEAASRNGFDVTRQPINRWAQHCNGRAIRNEGREAEAKAKTNGHKFPARPATIHELKTRRDVLETQLNTLRNKYGSGPLSKPWSDADKAKREELKKQITECVDQIAKG